MNAISYEVAATLLAQVKREIADHMRLWAATPNSMTFGRRGKEPAPIRQLLRSEIVDMIKRAKGHRDLLSLGV